jgi:hypothetical protein
VAQVHSFDSDPSLFAADKDWLSFELQAGQIVTMTIIQLTNTLTLLELYDGEGGLLTMTEASQLVWQAPVQDHYVAAVSPLTTTFGCSDAVGYVLMGTRESRHSLYLPVLLR